MINPSSPMIREDCAGCQKYAAGSILWKR